MRWHPAGGSGGSLVAAAAAALSCCSAEVLAFCAPPLHNHGGARCGTAVCGTSSGGRSAEAWEVTLELQGESRTVLMRPDDSILQAAELAGLRAPYDCRRGNCLTCAARFAPGSSFNVRTAIRGRERAGGAAVLDPDTFLCDEAKDEGFFLSCCSYPVGPGLTLELGVQREAWQIQYCDRLRDPATERAALAAVASVQREYSERNPLAFVASLERHFGDGGGGGGGVGAVGSEGDA